MRLPLRTFTELVNDMSAAVHAAAGRLLDVSVGSVLRAILEANASVVLWMQWLAVQVLQSTRAATSSDKELDSWMRDFGLERLPSTPAVGSVRFARQTAGTRALIPPGSRVKTADGTIGFTVIADARHALWSPADGCYVLTATQLAGEFPVQAESSGVSGNVQADTITLIATSLPGVDTVTNPAPLAGGHDAEPDDAFRERFRSYINSRSRATADAVEFAIASTRQGLRYTIDENTDAAGAQRAGHFLITVDDGTGVPSPSLLADVASAVGKVRPIGSVFAVHAPGIVHADISMNLDLAPGVQLGDVRTKVVSAVQRYVNGLGINARLSLTRLSQVAYAASDGITNISDVHINGQATDFGPPLRGVVKAGMVAVI